MAVAVPAVLGYNWLVRRNKQAMDSVRSFASDLHSVLLSGTRVGDKKDDKPKDYKPKDDKDKADEDKAEKDKKVSCRCIARPRRLTN